MIKFMGVTNRPADVPGFISVTGLFGRTDGEPISFTFVFHERFREWISDDTETWFILGATSAFILKEDYVHEGDVCPTLIRNIRSLIKQWKSFFPSRQQIRIEVSPKEHKGSDIEVNSQRKIACLFTGGVDSSFTLAVKRNHVDVLISAAFKFDKFHDYSYVKQTEDRYKYYFADLRVESLVVGTNMLDPFPEWGDAWSFITHGAALIAMSHLFSKKIGEAIISSSHAFGELIPWGSHPLTDPLLSSSTLTVAHFGATYSRYDKIKGLIDHQFKLDALKVCGKSTIEKVGLLNCSKCQKCLRTMAALDIHGANRTNCSAFDWSDYNMQALANAVLHHPNEFIFFRELIDGAERVGRYDIARAAGTAISRSAKYRLFISIENLVRRRFPIVSRLKKVKDIKRVFYRVMRPR